MSPKKTSASKGPLLILVLFLVLGTILFKDYAIPALKKALAGPAASGGSGVSLVADVTRDSFQTYAGYLQLRESIRITIVDTTIEYEIAARAGDAPGTGEFVVSAQTPSLFWKTDIAAEVGKGLKSIPTTRDSHHPPKWSGWSISTNKEERAWTVSLRGMAGEGSISFSIGEASALLPVKLPRLLPIWRYASFVDRRAGIVVIGGHDVHVGETIQPDLAHGLCGFRVHSISNRSVWFEVVYAEPNHELTRRLWPDLRIDYAELDNGQSLSKVVFESGHAMMAGDKAVFDEQGDALKLDADSFLSERAVRLRYLDRHGTLIADMIVVTFQ